MGVEHTLRPSGPRRAALLLAIPLWLGLAGRARADWELVTDEDGIRVMKQQVPGRDFPTFRALGTVNASIYQVLAVLSDVKRHTEWVSNCTDARVLRKVSETEYIIYTRTHAPWPVSDRDAVFRSTAHVHRRAQLLEVKFVAVWSNLMPPRKGLVRMTNLRGHYILRSLGPQKMLMDYVVDADPAGSLPKWVARLAVKKLPLDTIRALRKQAAKTQGWYSERIRNWIELEKTLPLVTSASR